MSSERVCDDCGDPIPDEYGKFDNDAPIYTDDGVYHLGCHHEMMEEVISQSDEMKELDDTRCEAIGPFGLECSRTENHDDAHTSYRKVEGQMYHIEWFKCNAIGEPVE